MSSLRRPEAALVIHIEARLHPGVGWDEQLHSVGRAVVGVPEWLIAPVGRAGPREARPVGGHRLRELLLLLGEIGRLNRVPQAEQVLNLGRMRRAVREAHRWQ